LKKKFVFFKNVVEKAGGQTIGSVYLGEVVGEAGGQICGSVSWVKL
jgi:hypothetical protein